MIKVKPQIVFIPFLICLLLSFNLQASESDTSVVKVEEAAADETSTSTESEIKSELTTAVDDATKSEEKPSEDPEEDEEEEPDCD